MNSTSRFSQLRWLPGFLAFPLAGLAGRAVAGPVDSVQASLIGGIATGLVLGLGQWLTSSGVLGSPARWLSATAVGYGLGLTAGSAAVDYGTGLASLIVMGAITGVFLSATQGSSLARQGRPKLAGAWAGAMPPLFAVGWAVTATIGVDVERHYTVFGAAGAIVVTVLSGLVLSRASTRDGGGRSPSPVAAARRAGL